MEFISYELTSSNSASLNTGSYLNQVEHSLFVKGYVGDLWYGFSNNDVIELGVWDRNQTPIAWQTLPQPNYYNHVTLSYFNSLNFPVTFSYKELEPNFILHKNEQILVNPSEELSSSLGILSGSYFLTYNFVREMAGSVNNPLVIKEISPSRREIKLIPLNSSSLQYEAFCQKKVLMSDVSSLYINSLKGCPYSQIYNKLAPLYPERISTLQSLFFLTTEADTIQFFRNMYEDYILYRTNPIITTTRIQGIQTYFNNYLLSNSEKITSFEEINNHFKTYVSASIERKFAPVGPNPVQLYLDAKEFIYEFFTTYFYNPISDILSSTYNEKYYSPLKNAINLGNNRLLPIVNSGYIDEKVEESDPLTLLIKLKNELPLDLSIQSQCWISNISISPFIVNAIIKNPENGIVHKIGPPNFSIPIPNASLTNTNLSYTAEDLKEDEQSSRDITVSKNIIELAVDYSDFNNFVIFSSAELRLRIFINKVTNLSSLSSSLDILNDKNEKFQSASGSFYPFYNQEYANIQGQMDNIVNSFDGYESYLYRGGSFSYQNGSFISSSFIDELKNEAITYDKYNVDSLINGSPEHILVNSENDDYITFLSMIGHFFDNIYIYISNIPSQRNIRNGASEEFTRKIVDYMLQTFGWNLDDSLEQSSILTNYLTSNEIAGLNSMSNEDRLKIVRNRVLINLPQIYKSKGTEEAVKLILACYGIPSALLNIREYGGINYGNDQASYTTYERVYMREWVTSSIYDTYYLQAPTGSHTYLFKLLVDNAEIYPYNKDIALFGKTDGIGIAQDISGSGLWTVGFRRVPKKNMGKMFFRIGYIDRPSFKFYTPEFPLFDGSIYSVMLRRNYLDPAFEFTTNENATPCKYDLYVQKNEFGNQILKITSSNVNYDITSNTLFDAGGNLNIGGWFSWNNGQAFVGCFDKFQMWLSPLSDNNFEDYVNNINSYAFSGSNPHQSLLFRMHTDYPFDQRQQPPNSGLPIGGIPNTDWLGIWRNANPFYAVSSSKTLQELYGTSGNVDYMVNWGAWEGYQKQVADTSSCPNLSGYTTQSAYPFQFRVIDYPSTWPISKYGPNKFRNEKVRHLSQSVEARFDTDFRSTYVSPNNVSPDSNQVGFFVDPNDFKNKDIIRYFGNFDLMDSIGDPSNQFSSSYQSLNILRKQYKDAHSPLSGSRTLFNELCTLFKLYFNRSVFEAIKNVVPARANILTGILVEPTLLERPKYESKEISSEVNNGSVLYFDVTASHYFRDPDTKILTPHASHELAKSACIEQVYTSLPTRDYPVNFGGNYIRDFSDQYNEGHFAGGILSNIELQSILLFPDVDFDGFPSKGCANLPVQFTGKFFNVTHFEWDFGDGTTDSTNETPIHIYSTKNINELTSSYTVTLKAWNGSIQNSISKQNFVVVTAPIIKAAFTATPTTGEAPFAVTFTDQTTVSCGNCNLTYDWDFGDGSPINHDKNPIHVYSTIGTYTVKLTVSCGMYSSTTSSVDMISSLTPSIPCGSGLTYNGGQTFPSIYTINLGTNTGEVVLNFDCYSNADKIIVIWDGNEVINTGYAGSLSRQSTLNAGLAARGLPPEPIVQYTNVPGHEGSGSLSFNKNLRDPQTATVQVWAPVGGTAWTFTLNCPI